MEAERRARSWNGLSWAIAILSVNAISMIPFEWVTRPKRGVESGVLALALGFVWGAGVFAATVGLSALIGWLLVGDSGFPG